MNPLDNAVRYALTGPQARFALGAGRVLRFPPAVAPFAALPDEPAPGDWEALKALVGPGEFVALFRPPLAVPAGWETPMRLECLQMVCPPGGERVPSLPGNGPRIEPLDAGDLAAMRDLVKRTEPGPFGPRTPEMGRYLGVHRDGALVAMAGERLRVPGATEISAVCTDPAYRGRGFAAALVNRLVHEIHTRDELPFLHVLVTNTPAIRVYQALGFSTRRRIEALALRVPA